MSTPAQATQVGQQFVQAYYNAFDTNRQGVASLFQAPSTMSFEGDNAVGPQAIVQKLVTIQLPPGSRHAVTTTDAQPSGCGSGAILVFVTGDFVGGGQKLKFQEVFQLVPSGGAGQYYIHNNIFRLGRNNPQNLPAATPQVGQVAMQFMAHYFQTFDGNRAQLAALYRPASVLTFEAASFQGPQAIMAKLGALPQVTHDGASCTVDVQAVNGVAIILVFVTGQLKIDQNPPMKFVQTFLLMQEGAGYYVRNDIFRLNYG
jgi:hypothetical protein